MRVRARARALTHAAARHASSRLPHTSQYGYITEVKVTGPGAYTAVKHYAMGRSAWEMAYVMPDNKTVYGASDARNGAFNKFVANTAGDLSSGTLYCAAFTQTSSANGGAFTINWISMGQLSDATISGLFGANPSTGLSFDDIFVADVPTGNVTGACNPGFTSVNTGYTYTTGGVKYFNGLRARARARAARRAIYCAAP